MGIEFGAADIHCQDRWHGWFAARASQIRIRAISAAGRQDHQPRGDIGAVAWFSLRSQFT
jgi:hypothetical protein